MKSHVLTMKGFALLVAVTLVFFLAIGLISNGAQAVTLEEEFPLLEDGGYFNNCRWAKILAYVLELTDTQKEEIQSIIDSERPTFEPLVRQITESRQEFWRINQSPSFDESAVRELASGQSEAITELIVIRNRIMFRVSQVLTPEQNNKVERYRERVKERIENCLALNSSNDNT